MEIIDLRGKPMMKALMYSHIKGKRIMAIIYLRGKYSM